MPLINILMIAFGLDRDQERIVAPEWTANFKERNERGVTTKDTAARYDIAATMPPGTSKEQSDEMLKNLLIDRFKLTYHMEKKQFDVYKVTVAAGGSKLQPAEAAAADGAAPSPAAPVTWGLTAMEIPEGSDGFPELPAGQPAMVGIFAGGGQKVRMTARAQPVSSILKMLNGAYVVDQTGLTGTYDFKLEYQLAGLALAFAHDFAGSGVTTPEIVTHTTRSEMFPGLLAAVEKQLGLKLEKAKAPLDVVVIDHIERIPEEN